VHWVFVTKVSAQGSIALPGAMVKLTQPRTEIDRVYSISGFIWPGIPLLIRYAGTPTRKKD
jgi:hypothetical protein